MSIVLLGVPGSGKGTQAKMMAKSYKVPHISTGEILRAAVAEKSPLSEKIARVMNSGDFVSDDIVINAVVERLRRPESRRGFILDGFPRNIPQAQELDTRPSWVTRSLQLALHFALDSTVLVKRITGRIVCGDCGAIYNRHFSPPEKRGVCDYCDARNLGQRLDDNEKSVRRRLETYETETAPLISYYKAQHKLRTVPADATPQEIFRFLCEVVDVEIRPLEKKVIPEQLHKKSQSEVVDQTRRGGIVSRQTSSQTSGTSPRTSANLSVGPKGSRKQVTKVSGAKRPTARKATAKKTKTKTAARKPPLKPTSRKQVTKVSGAKRPTARKATAKKTKTKTAARKPPLKPTSRKQVTKVSGAKRPTARKATAKKTKTKTAARKPPLKPTSRKQVTKVSGAKRPTARKATAKKTKTKTAARKPPLKPTSRKQVTKVSGAKRPTARKATAKKTKTKTAARKSLKPNTA